MRYNWRSPDAYKYVADDDYSAFAWEFIRRNPQYQKDFRSISDRGLDPELVVQRWGYNNNPNLSADRLKGKSIFTLTWLNALLSGLLLRSQLICSTWRRSGGR